MSDPGYALPPSLTTTRLRLRPLGLEDEPGIFAYASDPEVARFTLWEAHRSRDDSRSFLEAYAFANYRQEVPDPYGIFLKEAPGELLGTVGCHWASTLHLTMELGFALARPAWGRGITTEAAWAAVCFSFSICRPNRLQARCHPENRASARVLQKLGMRQEGCLRAAVCKGEETWDVLLFALTRRDWQRYVDTRPEGPPGTPL
ncbi:MAG: GNAT family N-acetyltransferase [Acidobacteria bacterium]|nr:GNAT family N-acetyltransferase [Acidobacteriota bacterium]